MKATQTHRNVNVKTTVRLEDAEPVTLLDGSTVWPVELQVEYWSMTPHEVANGCAWQLMAHCAKKNGTRGKAERDVREWDFQDSASSQDVTPSWLPELVAKYAPKDLASV